MPLRVVHPFDDQQWAKMIADMNAPITPEQQVKYDKIREGINDFCAHCAPFLNYKTNEPCRRCATS